MSDKSEDPPFPGTPVGDGFYILKPEDFEGATIFTPGIPDYDSGDFETLPHEAVTQATILKPVDVIIFFDKHSPHPVDEIDCNQWAFVVDHKQALYVRGGLVRSIKLADAHKLPNAIVIKRFGEPLTQYLAPMLLKYRWRPMWFQIAVNHLQVNNLAPFLYGEFFPPDQTYANDEEYQAAWQDMVSMLEPRDGIFTFDRHSAISKIISLGTHGPFSHCALYIGDGLISEIVTSGTRIVPIETYKGRRFRVAAYRHHGKVPDTIEEMTAKARSEDGRPGYSYYGALDAGVRALFGKHREAMTPNSLILTGFLAFIAQA